MTLADSPAQLAILGSWPPPTGGVAIHTQRLCGLLEQSGVKYVVYNATSAAGDGRTVISVFRGRRSWLVRYLFSGRERAVYSFSGRLSAWVIGGLMARLRGKRMLLRLRNSKLIDWIARSRWRRMLCGWSLRQMDGVVCVNRHLAEAAVKLGVDPARVHWSPGFLPPRASEEVRDGVAPAVWAFVDQHEPIIAANGKADVYQGVDLYGLDMMIELAARLRADYPRLGIVVCFWEHRAEEEAQLSALREHARRLGVESNILFNTQVGTFIPVLTAADVFVRPTASDGDANSIREALYLDVPAVASDVVERPAGTRLFRNRDVDAFTAQVRNALTTRKTPAERRPQLGESDRQRIDAYVELLTAFANGSPLPLARPWQVTNARPAAHAASPHTQRVNTP